jgi:hypothetical protein
MQTDQDYLLGEVTRTGNSFVRGIITEREFVNKVLGLFAHSEHVFVELIPKLWQAIPAALRVEFASSIREAAKPDFRYHAFYIGGGRPQTEDEILRDANLRTSRVRAWALEFVRFLDSLEPATQS